MDDINDGDYEKNISSDYFDDKKWEWKFFRNECKNLELETFYTTYILRLQRSFLSIFLVLQTIIGIVHTVVLVASQRGNTPIYVELIAYLISILLTWLSLFCTFHEGLIRRFSWIPYIASCCAIFSLVIADLIVPLYHSMVTFPQPALRPAYACHILFAIYIFLPLMENWHSFILGIATSACYLIVFLMVTYRLDDEWLLKVITEIIFLICINLFGLYFRLMNEIAIRRTFLDRRECVAGNLMLEYARNQERDLLLSILPEHIAAALEKDIRSMITTIRRRKQTTTDLTYMENPKTFDMTLTRFWRDQDNNPYVCEHNNVTILYADIVNYTVLTTKLDVKDLVKIIHELFVKFDQASEEFNVLRIKFLGDCYYCVSGVPKETPLHAQNCVELGLRMIQDIRDVRKKLKLNIDQDIDMRIGVHSGKIMSGVIGVCKWQYDVWSTDVKIANKMESTGEPGKVHITQQTLKLLDRKCYPHPGTKAACNDPLLQKYEIKTYLIVPNNIENEKYSTQDSVVSKRESSGVQKKILEGTTRKSRSSEMSTVCRNFMQNSMEEFNKMRQEIKVEMSKELEMMPIGKFHLNKIFAGSSGHRLTEKDIEKQDLRSLSTIFLCFKDKNSELSFQQETDLMLKYSILTGFIVFLVIIAIQVLNKPFGTIFWTIFTGSILFLFIPIVWFKKIWVMITPEIEDDNNNKSVPLPGNSLLKNFYYCSEYILKSPVVRTFIYITTILILVLTSLINLADCGHLESIEEIRLKCNDFSISSLTMPENSRYSICLNAWAITECLTLAICMNFLFLRIHFLIKFIVGVTITIFYCWLIFFQVPCVYTNSQSTNPSLNPAISHLMAIIFITITFHLIDRQTEYISRIDYNWKKQLLKKHEQAGITKDTNKILVQNILPAHVAETYINRNLKDDFYHEQYENVAVMFATIPNSFEDSLKSERGVLRDFNEIICDFDEKLLSHSGPLKIEKIKVANWTYMVACGLDPGRGDSSSSLHYPEYGVRSSKVRLTGGGRKKLTYTNGNGTNNNNIESKLSTNKPCLNPVYVLTEFALDLMKVFESFRKENWQNSHLRIGISNGNVMGGVVGLSKPLYDIWGNPVNMASRMDSTGQPGKIQVTKNTAKILKSFNIKCDYRGRTAVKGAGLIPTYYICTDNNFNFVKKVYDRADDDDVEEEENRTVKEKEENSDEDEDLVEATYL